MVGEGKNHKKPLLILDCDEVILEFAGPFARWLREARNVELRYESYALLGNMRFVDSGALVPREQLWELLAEFFSEGQPMQTPVAGVLDAIEAVQSDCELVVLTNVPEVGKAAREQRLQELGLMCPVVINSGAKGRKVQQLAQGRKALFVDDAPSHHESVAHHAPEVRRLHMVASDVLRPLIPAAEHAHARHDQWTDALPWLQDWLRN